MLARQAVYLSSRDACLRLVHLSTWALSGPQQLSEPDSPLWSALEALVRRISCFPAERLTEIDAAQLFHGHLLVLLLWRGEGEAGVNPLGLGKVRFRNCRDRLHRTGKYALQYVCRC